MKQTNIDTHVANGVDVEPHRTDDAAAHKGFAYKDILKILLFGHEKKYYIDCI